MKKMLGLLSIVFLVSLIACGGNEKQQVEIVVEKASYKPGEKDALIVLKAYADKDLETLKKYATGSQKMVMDEEYFKTNGNVTSFREKLVHWTGSFNEIRYNKEDINFETYYFVTAPFYESPSGQLTAIKLKSTDKENWKLSGFGTAYLKKQEFEELSPEIPE